MRKRDLKIGLLIAAYAFHSADSAAIVKSSTTGAREAALSHAVVALSGSFSVFHNQAFLTESKSTSLGLSYRQPYLINGYCEGALSVVHPTKTAVFAIGVTQSSIATYKESEYGFAIAKKLGGKLSAGVLFNCFILNFPEVGRHKGSVMVDGGIRYRFSDRLALGVHLKNIVWSKIETFQYSLKFPFVIRAGTAYLLTESILLTEEVDIEQDVGFGFRCGTELALTDFFRIRGGLSTKPFQHSFGFGYRLSFCQMDFAVVHHEILGYSPVISFSFNLSK
jgi:long-subunit fatty acid transport protein